jgi:heme-degrading monooxygenase HmoA
MWVRQWSARATPEGAESYRAHFQRDVRPRLETIPGHRGALLLRRDDGSRVTLVVLTFWESMDAIRSFAGTDITTAVVAPEARAFLEDYDRDVVLFDVLADTRA